MPQSLTPLSTKLNEEGFYAVLAIEAINGSVDASTLVASVCQKQAAYENTRRRLQGLKMLTGYSLKMPTYSNAVSMTAGQLFRCSTIARLPARELCGDDDPGTYPMVTEGRDPMFSSDGFPPTG